MIYQKLITKMPVPKKCVISITDKCSMRCKMCYNWTLKDSHESVSLKTWKRVVKELAELKKDEMLLNFIGGEPFEKSWALEIVKEASKYNIKTSLTTNATIINETKVNKIIESGLNTLCISLDSLNPNTHDYYRGVKGTYGKVMNALNIFKKNPGPEIIIQSIIMDKNMEDILDLIKWTDNQNHIVGVYLMAIMKPHHTNLPDDWYKNDNKGLWPINMDEMSTTILKLIKMKNNGSKIVNSNLHLKSYENYYLYPERFIKSKFCDVADFGIYIDALGNVSICAEKGIIGNIKNTHLKEVWFSCEALKVKERMGSCKKNCEFLVNCFYQDEK